MSRRHYDYYAALYQMADYSWQAAGCLRDTLDAFSTQALTAGLSALALLVESAKRQYHELLAHVERDFLPPLERADIVALAQLAQEQTQSAEAALVCFYIYNLNEAPAAARELASLVAESYSLMKQLFAALPQLAQDVEWRQSVCLLEQKAGQGEACLRQAVRSLYLNSVTSVSLVAWQETYHKLGRCCRNCLRLAELVDLVRIRNT